MLISWVNDRGHAARDRGCPGAGWQVLSELFAHDLEDVFRHATKAGEFAAGNGDHLAAADGHLVFARHLLGGFAWRRDQRTHARPSCHNIAGGERLNVEVAGQGRQQILNIVQINLGPQRSCALVVGVGCADIDNVTARDRKNRAPI